MNNDKVVDIINELRNKNEITELTGEGQAVCSNCKERTWCCFIEKYKGKNYCYKCLYEVIKNEYNL